MYQFTHIKLFLTVRHMYIGKKLMHGQKFGKIYIILYILNTYSNYPRMVIHLVFSVFTELYSKNR